MPDAGFAAAAFGPRRTPRQFRKLQDHVVVQRSSRANRTCSRSCPNSGHVQRNVVRLDGAARFADIHAKRANIGARPGRAANLTPGELGEGLQFRAQIKSCSWVLLSRTGPLITGFAVPSRDRQRGGQGSPS